MRLRGVLWLILSDREEVFASVVRIIQADYDLGSKQTAQTAPEDTTKETEQSLFHLFTHTYKTLTFSTVVSREKSDMS